jgi:hypothetical protein
MRYEQIINRLIPADDLHWDERQGRYASISQEEVEEVIARCTEQGITDHDKVRKIVEWIGFLRIGVLLRDAFMSGRVRIAAIGDDGPYFSPLENAP